MSDKDVQKTQSAVATEKIRNVKTFVPRVDIYETKEALFLIADMPGVDEKSVDITLDKNVLTITGAIVPYEIKDHSVYYAEYDTGDYERAFTITDEVDRDRIEANVRNGVLKVTLHKIEKAKVKKIAIKAG